MDLAAGSPTHDRVAASGLKRFARNRGSVVGAVVLAVVLLASLFAHQLAPYPYYRIDARAALQPPSATHFFGTDAFGRDIFSRVLVGSRYSLGLGLAAVAIGALGGLVLGVLAGYYGSWIDDSISRFIDILLAFPGILLAFAVVAVLGPGFANLTVAIGIGAIPGFTRLVRSAVITIREREYVAAARALGTSDMRIAAKHIVPNLLGPFTVYATLHLGTAILSGAALSFLGLGASPPTPELGLMLSEGRSYLRHAWWWSTFPGMAITLVIVSANLVGDGLIDALDPTFRGT